MKINTYRQMRLLALLAVSFVYIGSYAQVWNKTYIEDRPVLLFSSILQSGNNYYVTGVTADKGGLTNFDRVFIGKLDITGNVFKYKTITDSVGKTYSAYFNTLIKDNSDNLVFAGYSIDSLSKLLLVKTDENLNNIQVFEYSTPNTSAFQGRSMLQHTDGHYYIAGVRTEQNINNASVVLLKIDTNGNRIWERLYNQNKIDYAESIISLSNGNLMLGAYRTNIDQTNEIANTWLIEVNTGGAIQRQWFDTNDSSYVAKGLLQTSDDGFIYGAQKKYWQSINSVYSIGTVVKLDSDFNKQWMYTGGSYSDVTGIYDIVELADGSFICSGNKPFYNNDSSMLSGWIIKLSSTGQVIWNRTYAGFKTQFSHNYLTDIDVHSDGSLIAVGQCQNPGHTPPQVGWFLKLDSNGCEIENCMVGLPDDGQQETDNRQLQIYPNPFTSHISIALNSTHTATLTITNLTGQTVYRQTETNLAPDYTKMLDLSYLPNGVYFVEVSTAEGKAVKRVVKE